MQLCFCSTENKILLVYDDQTEVDNLCLKGDDFFAPLLCGPVLNINLVIVRKKYEFSSTKALLEEICILVMF